MKMLYGIVTFHFCHFFLIFPVKSKDEVTPFLLCLLHSYKLKFNGASSYLQLSGIRVEEEHIYD